MQISERIQFFKRRKLYRNLYNIFIYCYGCKCHRSSWRVFAVRNTVYNMREREREKLAATGISLAHAPQTHRKHCAIWFAERESILKDCSHVPAICVWNRPTVLKT